VEPDESSDLDDRQAYALAPSWIGDGVWRELQALCGVGNIEELDVVQATEPPLGIRVPGFFARSLDR
jgi:hypothetical protein